MEFRVYAVWAGNADLPIGITVIANQEIGGPAVLRTLRLPGIVDKGRWRFGILEWWNDGIVGIARRRTHHSNVPWFHYSNPPAVYHV